MRWAFAALFVSSCAQDRPLAPAQPVQISCSDGTSTGTLQVSCAADFATADVVSFGLARADDSQQWAHVHYVADVAEDGSATAVIPGLVAGVQYIVTARAHHRGASLGWNEKWSAVASERATCRAGAGDALLEAHVDTDAVVSAATSDTTWIEVYRYRGSGYSKENPIKDYNLPDFLDNHNTGDANKQLSRCDFPCSESDKSVFNQVSYTRYCVEVLNVQLSTTVHGVGVGGPKHTTPFATYLPCDAGKCHCANKFDAFSLEAEINTPRSWVDSNCPSGQAYCNCEEEQLSLAANYTGRWTYSPPFTDNAWMDGSGNPRCGWGSHTYPCHGDADPKGYFYHHPEGAKCKSNEKVGDNGCTWKASPLMHTMSVQQLVDAGSLGGVLQYRNMQIEEELQSRDKGLRAFETIGAMPCGSVLPPPSPPSPPLPPSPPPPSPSPECPGGSLRSCIDSCPTDVAVYNICVNVCLDRCSSAEALWVA